VRGGRSGIYERDMPCATVPRTRRAPNGKAPSAANTEAAGFMDFSKLSSNDKLAVYGAAATIVGAIAGYSYGGIGLLAVLAAIGMLAIVFLPQLSPSTRLPGSKGSLMLIAGGLAGALMALALLSALSILFINFGIGDILFLIAVAGGLLMAWAGWQAFQAEGGKFTVGMAGGPAAASSAPAEPAAPAAPPPPAAPAAQAEPMRPAEPMTPQEPMAPHEPMAPPEPMGRPDESDEERTS